MTVEVTVLAYLNSLKQVTISKSYTKQKLGSENYMLKVCKERGPRVTIKVKECVTSGQGHDDVVCRVACRPVLLKRSVT